MLYKEVGIFIRIQIKSGWELLLRSAAMRSFMLAFSIIAVVQGEKMKLKRDTFQNNSMKKFKILTKLRQTS